ncbi:hypothetical protein T440DRAFT_474666 [Plenodomus tracheiphilus IPT5]|uniref:F-box domain-containing protein n=1 Tax=Plenodomus tracheiphilus IPT5 TaxID=1408161 RepID=A0A6A7BLT8_9PLEO|nr:hypothetical protein T440DRAFT_474666 [Plenodomus tracheiphilus IPT5]
MDDRGSRPGNAAPAATTAASTTANTHANTNAHAHAPKVQQPKPQALPARSGPSSILVSPRQKGNPILNNVRAVAWEYSDIPADYVVGATTCALFLSLKYHRLHPEYIYNRIRDLKGQYSLRILLTMVDIENHEEPLRELSKTSIVNNVTVMLCWSANEAGRYLEQFKIFENAAPTSIRAHQSGSYSEKMVDFITAPRSINKTDAVGLVSNFGSIRTAINATPEEIGLIAGWGDKKVQRWHNAVREPFRVKKAARRAIGREDTRATMSRTESTAEGHDHTPMETAEETTQQRVDETVPLAIDMQRTAPFATTGADADTPPAHRPAEHLNALQSPVDNEDAMRQVENVQTATRQQQPAASQAAKRKQAEEDLSEGVMAALSLTMILEASKATRTPLPHTAVQIVSSFMSRTSIMAPFELFPAELLIAIFAHLDLSDVKAMRKVCKTFGDFLSPALYQSVVACARNQGLGAFQNIAKHPNYSGYVKEIVFDGTVFVENFAKSDDIYHRAEENFVELDTPDLGQKRDRWKRYQVFYQEQEDMKTSGMLLQTLAHALESLPNVSTLVYSPHARVLPIERNDMRDLVPVGFTCYPTADSRRGYTTPDHAFRHLLRAICLANFTGVRRLKIEPARAKVPATELSTEFFDMPTEADLQAGKHLFRNLTDIELNMALRDVNVEHMVAPAQQTTPQLGQPLAILAELLATAKDLQHLTLVVSRFALWDEATNGYYRYLRRFLPQQGMPPTVWTKLQTLSLDGLYASQHEWTGVIKQHCGTLRTVTFRHCKITAGLWAKVVDEIIARSSTVSSFVLHLVSENDVSVSREDRELWEYEGHLVVTDNQERNFIDTNPVKHSVFARSEGQLIDLVLNPYV